MNPSRLTKLLATGLLTGGLALGTGCVYRIDIQQGNYLGDEKIQQVQVGMTKDQVRFLLGTPIIQDPFHPDRWDYVYYYKRGRSRNVDQRQMTIFFDEDAVREIVTDVPAAVTGES